MFCHSSPKLHTACNLLSPLRCPALHCHCCTAAVLQAARLYNEDRKEYNRRVKAVVEASWADDGEDDGEEEEEDGGEEAA